MIHNLPTSITQTTPIDHNKMSLSQIIDSQDFPQHCGPRNKMQL
jgi:hypothetical protein